MIWPKGAHDEFVIGVFDDETGKIIKEWRVKPGEEIPEEALAIYQKSIQSGEFVQNINYSELPFSTGYDSKIAENVLRKQ